MTTVLLAAAGVALILLVVVDALTTTLAVGSGAGPVCGRVNAALWRLLLRLHRRDRRSGALGTAGIGLLLGSVAWWVLGLWAGWTLVLLSGRGVESDSTGATAGFWDVAYYAGFTVSTLGVGDYVGTAPGWRVLTAVAGLSGLFLVTLAITYLVSVVSAVVARRALALRIHALGESSTALVARGWAGDAFTSAFVQHLVTLTGELVTSAEQQVAYPVLRYFRSSDPDASTPLALARLDEAMLLLQAGVAPSARPDVSAVDPVRRAVDRYLTTASGLLASRDLDDPPLPDLAVLADAGVPIGESAELVAAAAQEGDRRRRLVALVHEDGWSWPDA